MTILICIGQAAPQERKIMSINKLEMSSEVAALSNAMTKQTEAMQNLNVSYGGKNGGINRWRYDTITEQIAENLELIAFWENLIQEAKAATAELQSTVHAIPELIAHEKAQYEEYAKA
jgi:hypothetical protein